ncbi:MAG: hypothetical protein FWG28_03290 [Clostridiales bacterium]|nr:hypothetical protein [Clostridiales bacterium]
MFQMTVDEIFEIHDVYTVYGECNGMNNLKPGTLKDETGREYGFSIPVGKDLVIDRSKIWLILIGEHIDLQSLLGQRLYQEAS